MIAASVPAMGTSASAQWVDNGSSKSYVTKDGKTVTGWVRIGGKKYYFGADGKMRTGMIKLDGKTYYFGDDGVMRTGKVTIKGKTYDFGTDGVLKTALKSDSSTPEIKWTMTKDDIKKLYKNDNVVDLSFALVTGDGKNGAMYGFDPESGKLMFYAFYSQDGLKSCRNKLKNEGFKYVEKQTQDGTDAYLYKKGTNYAFAAESEGVSMISYMSPALSIVYASKGKEGLQELIDSYYDSIGGGFTFNGGQF